MTTMAVNVMAKAPFGHAVTIQKISAALMATNVRPALTKAGHQSATWSLARRPPSRGSAFPVSNPSASSPCIKRLLQHRRMVPKSRRFSDRLVDHGVERNDLSDELASNRLLRVGRRRSCRRQCGAETIDDFG